MQSDPIGLYGGLNGWSYVDQAPTIASDPFGLVRWEGTGISFGIVKGGGIIYERYTLESECLAGIKYFVEIEARGVAVGLGAKFHPHQVALGTAVGRKIVFRDGRAIPDPSVFNGTFFKMSYGSVFGVGIGGQSTELGEAKSNSAASVSFGFDASVGVFFGESRVISHRKITCGCQ